MTIADRYHALNQRIAVTITHGVSTMECAYFFALLAIIGFPGFHATPTAYVQWVSQTFIQLVMLSVIMVGQQTMNEHHTSHRAEIARLHDKIDALAPRLTRSHRKKADDAQKESGGRPGQVVSRAPRQRSQAQKPSPSHEGGKIGIEEL